MYQNDYILDVFKSSGIKHRQFIEILLCFNSIYNQNGQSIFGLQNEWVFDTT